MLPRAQDEFEGIKVKSSAKGSSFTAHSNVNSLGLNPTFQPEQFCRVNGVDSKLGDIEVGAPQGSCLGPLLFLVFINDHSQGVQDSTVSMYADNTSLLCFLNHS